jgi:hypothetical protein
LEHVVAACGKASIKEPENLLNQCPTLPGISKASAEKDVCETMDLEDEILDELESLERKILDKEKALEDKDKVIEDKDKALEDKDKAIKNALEALVNSGMTLNAAKKVLGLSQCK